MATIMTRTDDFCRQQHFTVPETDFFRGNYLGFWKFPFTGMTQLIATCVTTGLDVSITLRTDFWDSLSSCADSTEDGADVERLSQKYGMRKRVQPRHSRESGNPEKVILCLPTHSGWLAGNNKKMDSCFHRNDNPLLFSSTVVMGQPLDICRPRKHLLENTIFIATLDFGKRLVRYNP